MAITQPARGARRGLRSTCCAWIFTVVSAMPRGGRSPVARRRAMPRRISLLARRGRSSGEGPARAARRRPPAWAPRKAATSLPGHLLGHPRSRRASRGDRRPAPRPRRLEQVAAGAAAAADPASSSLTVSMITPPWARLAQRGRRVDAVDAGQVVVEQIRSELQLARGAAPSPAIAGIAGPPGSRSSPSSAITPRRNSEWSSTTRIRTSGAASPHP